MNDKNRPKRRIYIFYILGILLSTTVLTVDVFSEKSFSTFISNKLSLLAPTPVLVSSDFSFPSFEIFKTKSSLINENVRLKNEVIELRKLKTVNDELNSQLDSNNSVIREVDEAIYNIFESSIIFKNLNFLKNIFINP